MGQFCTRMRIVFTLLIIIDGIISAVTISGAKIVPMKDLKNLYKIKKNDITKAALVVADAFKEDPLFKRLFGDANKNAHKCALVAEFMIRYCHTYGSVYATSENYEGIMAITQGKYTYMTLWGMIRSGSIYPLFKMGFKSLILSSSLSPIEVSRKKYMKNKSFAYIQVIGVALESQGKGFGGRMLQELIEVTDEAKLPIYLETETESNVQLYERFGFKTIEQMDLPVINHPMWTMIREVSIDEWKIRQ